MSGTCPCGQPAHNNTGHCNGCLDKLTRQIMSGLPGQVIAALSPNGDPPNGTRVRCGGCGEVVYDECRVLKNHYVHRLDDGRCRWTSLDFNVVVHECAPATSVVAQAEEILSAES